MRARRPHRRRSAPPRLRPGAPTVPRRAARRWPAPRRTALPQLVCGACGAESGHTPAASALVRRAWRDFGGASSPRRQPFRPRTPCPPPAAPCCGTAHPRPAARVGGIDGRCLPWPPPAVRPAPSGPAPPGPPPRRAGTPCWRTQRRERCRRRAASAPTCPARPRTPRPTPRGKPAVPRRDRHTGTGNCSPVRAPCADLCWPPPRGRCRRPRHRASSAQCSSRAHRPVVRRVRRCRARRRRPRRNRRAGCRA